MQVRGVARGGLRRLKYPLGSGVITSNVQIRGFSPTSGEGLEFEMSTFPPPPWASPGYATAGVQYTFYLYCVTITLHRTHCTLLPPTVSDCSKIAMKYPGFCCSLRPLEEGGCSSEFFQDDLMAAGESASVENKMITLFKLRTSPTLYIIQGSGLHTALLVLSTIFFKEYFPGPVLH